MGLVFFDMFFSILICFLSYKFIISRYIPLQLPKGNRDITIDGVRGFLALMVMTHHYFIFNNYMNTGDWTPPDNNFIRNVGVFAVYVFFIITGYLFIGRMIHYRDSSKFPNWHVIFKSRLFRILPLYFFVVIVSYCIAIFKSDFSLNVHGVHLIKEIIHWVTFTGWNINGDGDNRLIHAGVTWTLKYEWLFYCFLPFTYMIINSKIPTLLTGLILIFFSIHPFDSLLFDTRLFSLFAIGGCIAKLKSINFSILKNNNNFMYTCFLVFFIMISLVLSSGNSSFLIFISSSFCFFAISSGNSVFGLLKSNTARLLGEISYGIYLIHGVVIYLFFTKLIGSVNNSYAKDIFYFLPVLMVSVSLIATILFKYIELPFIQIGKKTLTIKYK